MAETAYVPRLRTGQHQLDRPADHTGRERGKRGVVRQVMPTRGTALVQDINISKRHFKPGRARQAGIVDIEQPIHLSNLAYVGKDGKATRVGFKIQADGTKVRVAKSSGAEIDG